MAIKNINPYAIYVNCDGAMAYDSRNTGGVGFIIKFPETIPLEDISKSIGIYVGGNIERLEMESIVQAMHSLMELWDQHNELLKDINQIIFITDRQGLCDSERTSPYKIKEWRRKKWKNFEGKPIKNHELLDRLDKKRKKLINYTRARVTIEYWPRKLNRGADKLAKAGKSSGLINQSLAKKGEKIGKRKFTGGEINYSKLSVNDELHIRVFRKDPVQNEWEIWGEICDGPWVGNKLKIYVDDKLATELKRMNEYIVKIKIIYTHHIIIYRTIRKRNKKEISN